MTIKQLSSSIAFFLCLESSAFANADIVKKFFTLQKAEITEITEDPSALQFPKAIDSGSNDIDCIQKEDLTSDAIINIGRAVWSIIESGKPSNDAQSCFASGIPSGVDWHSLDSWLMPAAKSFQVQQKNFLGMTIFKFTYRIYYTAGGRFKNNGQYLANVTVQAANVDVGWGTKLSATAQIPSVTNAGTTESPHAAMQILINWKVSRFFSFHEDSATYFVSGNGYFQSLNPEADEIKVAS